MVFELFFCGVCLAFEWRLCCLSGVPVVCVVFE